MEETLKLIKSDLSKLSTYKGQDINLKKIIKAYIGRKGAQAVILYRIAHSIGKKSNILGTLIANYSIRKTGCEIRHKAKIGKGFKICHTVGIVISDSACIGENFRVYQGVTIGKNNPNMVNKIGDNVTILAGAKVLVENVGNNVMVGANSVVIKDVSDNCVVAGVPAKIIKKTS